MALSSIEVGAKLEIKARWLGRGSKKASPMMSESFSMLLSRDEASEVSEESEPSCCCLDILGKAGVGTSRKSKAFVVSFPKATN